MKKLITALFFACTFTYTSVAQTRVPQADLATVEAIVNAGLKIISGPKDQPRDMEQFKALFLPGAQMGGVFFKGDSSFVRVFTVESFADKNGPVYAKLGFYENQLSLKVEQFGNIATAFQAYETRFGKDGKVEDRGVNTYQLVYDKGRWWIASLMFTPENPKNQLPKKYLK